MACLALAGPLLAGQFYFRSNINIPWGLNTNEQAMDLVFESGNWTSETFKTVDVGLLFSGSTRFIFLEGGDFRADALEAFLAANQAALEAWVWAGGRLPLNAAPNEGDGMSYGFAGVTLNYDYFSFFSGQVVAANPGHPVFHGPFTPVTTAYTGWWFAHATVTGGGISPIISDDLSEATVLGEKQCGAGLALFGAMTPDYFHLPLPEAANLRDNLIHYTANAGLIPPAPKSRNQGPGLCWREDWP